MHASSNAHLRRPVGIRRQAVAPSAAVYLAAALTNRQTPAPTGLMHPA